MKNTRSVFILLIGMISLTAFATTSKLDQKQKLVLKTEQSFQVNAVNVELASVVSDAKLSQNNIIDLQFVQEIKSINPVASIKDVGWQSLKRNYNLHFNQSNLLKTKRIPFVSLIDKGNKIRNDC